MALEESEPDEAEDEAIKNFGERAGFSTQTRLRKVSHHSDQVSAAEI